jgi:hypothetical protein
MNESFLLKIIEALIMANLVQPFDKQRALDVIKDKLKDEMHVVWNIQDIYDQAEDDGIELDSNQAQEILASLHQKHDATVGINWDVISAAIAEHLRNKES